jgi:hypothetical protein
MMAAVGVVVVVVVVVVPCVWGGCVPGDSQRATYASSSVKIIQSHVAVSPPACTKGGIEVAQALDDVDATSVTTAAADNPAMVARLWLTTLCVRTARSTDGLARCKWNEQCPWT